MLKPQHAVVIVLAVGLAACGESSTLQVADGTGPSPKLPEPNKTLIPTVNIAPAIGWANGATPTAAAGLKVAAFAEHLDHPRWLYVLPNGDVLVAETNSPAKPDDSKGIKGWIADKVMARAGAGVPSANRITLLRDADHDGVAETRTVFIENLNSPFGMTLVGNDLYVADTDKLLRFPYQPGEDRISAQPVKVADLPGGPLNHHWTKNVIASPDGKKLYVTVGSNSNVGENGMDQEQGRAAIWEVDPATGSQRIFASGLRNPNGMAWEPDTNVLWTVVNERDEIGSDLVPDYLTSVRDGGFYGWPWSYWGGVVDTRVQPQQPEKVATAIRPDYALGNHVAPLGLAFSSARGMPEEFANGAFIGEHGSWNRNPPSGYRVSFVPFIGGKPSGAPREFLTGFLSADGKALGRPVGVALDKSGALLVADDVGGAVWRVSRAR